MQFKFNSEGKKCTLDLPASADEFTFGHYLDMVVVARAFEGSGRTDIEIMIDTIAKICKGDWRLLPLQLSGDEGLTQGFLLNQGDPLTVIRIYLHLLTIVNAHQHAAKDIQVCYKGDNYTIAPSFAAQGGKKIPLTVGEYVEFLEYDRLLEEGRKNIPEDRGDLMGNMEFRMGLKQMAVLLRKEGELLPADKNIRDSFILDRAEFFQELPLGTIIDTRHFFFNEHKRLFSTPQYRFFFERKTKKGEKRPDYGAREESEAVWKLMGHTTIYERAMQLDSFGSFTDMFYSSIEQIISRLSLQEAMR